MFLTLRHEHFRTRHACPRGSTEGTDRPAIPPDLLAVGRTGPHTQRHGGGRRAVLGGRTPLPAVDAEPGPCRHPPGQPPCPDRCPGPGRCAADSVVRPARGYPFGHRGTVASAAAPREDACWWSPTPHRARTGTMAAHPLRRERDLAR